MRKLVDQRLFEPTFFCFQSHVLTTAKLRNNEEQKFLERFTTIICVFYRKCWLKAGLADIYRDLKSKSYHFENKTSSILIEQARPGPSRFISKAQKYSRNNNWKHLEIFFEKKYLVKKVAYCRKTQKRPFRLNKRFLQTENFKKIQEGTL